MPKQFITESRADLTEEQSAAVQDHIDLEKALLTLPGAVGTAISANDKARHAMEELLEGYLAHRTGLDLPDRVASSLTPREVAESGARGLVKALGDAQGQEVVRHFKAHVDEAIDIGRGPRIYG